MNKEVGKNPNAVWPRSLAAGIVFAIGATGCSATGTQEIAGSEAPMTPVECVGESLNSYEVEARAEAIKQNIDNMLCETANVAASQALETYRENGILISSRDEGSVERDSEEYKFNYLKAYGTFVSVKFGTTTEGKPDLSDLRRVYISEDEYGDDGEVTGKTTTLLSRSENGLWAISGYSQIENEPANDWYYIPSNTEITQDMATMQDTQDRVFKLSLNFISV